LPIDSAPGLLEVGALMALEQKLSLRLSQRLVMTPTLQQSIKMLQLTKLELEGYLAQELVENPVLEDLREGDDEPVDPEERAAIDTAAGTAPEQEAGERGEESAAPESREVEPEPEPRDPLDEIDLDAYYGEVFESSGLRGP
jgi:RNA polymerase sigma-54 factor